MYRWALTAALVLALPPVAGLSPASAQEKYALLVGINEYQHEDLPALSWAEADVTDLAAVLKRAGYKVILLTGSARDKDHKATKAGIVRHLKAVIRQCRKGDTLLLAFSGHGLRFEKKEETDPNDAYFCPLDALPFRDERETLVSLALVYKEMKKSLAGMKVLLVDACRADPEAVKGSKGGITANSLPPPEGVAALFSCRDRERAWENEKLGHSVFFHHVLEGLRGDARAPDGEVSFTWLAGHVMKRVPQTVMKLVKGKQSPSLIGDFSSDPVLLMQKATGEPPSTETEKTAKTFKNTIGIEFVRIPAGTFRMGSPAYEAGRDADEAQHALEITRAFYMGKYPVTVREFRAFVNASGYETEAETDGRGGLLHRQGRIPLRPGPEFQLARSRVRSG